ncbi:MAG: hypothetical protein LBP85_09750 [Prevotellaceae bacterium]|jgi:uncharacterized protein YhaN|nr:hypothetical protein [Prevotellaceae bacterium]
MEKENKRLRPLLLQDDAYVLNALQGITGYSPINSELSLDNLLALYQAMLNAQKTEVQKEGEMKAARDRAVKNEHDFHNAILGVKDQIRAQFGASSDEYQSIGMKKKTEYKTRKKKAE